MPPTITDADVAELKRTQENIHAVSQLFTAIAAHSATVSLAAEIAVKSADLQVIRSITWVLESMTTTIQNRKPQLAPPRPRLDS